MIPGRIIEQDSAECHTQESQLCLGWSGGAMVLGKLPVPGRPTYLD